MKTKSVLFASLAALAAGLFVPVLSAEPSADGKGPKGPPAIAQRVERMKTELGLSDAQVDQLRPIMQEHARALKALRDDASASRRDRRAELQKLRKAHLEQVQAILTPEQRAKAAEMRADRPQRKGPGGPSAGKGPKGPSPAEASAVE